MHMGEYFSECQGGVGRYDKLFWAKFSKISTLWVRSGKNIAIFPCFLDISTLILTFFAK